MARRSSDYIETISDRIKRDDEIAEYQKTHKDPRKTYVATYLIYGKQITEKVIAVTQQQAIDKIKQNCSLVGWNPVSLNVTEMQNN